MPNYRRVQTQGASYFFTVVSYQRQMILCDEPVRKALRKSITAVQTLYPFKIEAWVLLPDHLHTIWTLPQGDSNYSKRWSMIKRKVSLECSFAYKNIALINRSKHKHRESTFWQRRFWEHQIRDQDDYNNHMDYIHFNPVKHGLCDVAVEWPYSTLHKLIKEGVYAADWCGVSSDDNKPYGE